MENGWRPEILSVRGHRSLAHKHGRYLWIERREQWVGGKENAAANPRPQGERNERRLSLGFGLQLHVPIGQFDRVFDACAVILLANLLRLFLHEHGKRVDRA